MNANILNEKDYTRGICGLAYAYTLFYTAVDPLGHACPDFCPYHGVAYSHNWSYQTHAISEGEIMVLLAYEYPSVATEERRRAASPGYYPPSPMVFLKLLVGETVGWACMTKDAWRRMTVGYLKLVGGTNNGGKHEG